MDYLGWELERQRSALAALLLGGGETRDGEPARGGTQQNSAGAPGGHTGGPKAAPGAWEAVREVWHDHDGGAAKAVETPVSAWEAVLGGEEVWAVRRGRENGGAGTIETPVSARETILDGEISGLTNSEKAAWPWRSGGTGAQPGSLQPSGGYPARRGIRRIEAGLTAESQAASAKSGGDGAESGAVSPETVTYQDRMAGSTAAAKYPAPFLKVRRDGGSTADTLTGDSAAGAGTVPWGGWGAATLRAEDSAKTLSRAVQRDARRYDGGFNIF